MSSGYPAGMPWDGYWRVTRLQVFFYPLVTVFAATKAEADLIAGPLPVALEKAELLFDSIAAQRALAAS